MHELFEELVTYRLQPTAATYNTFIEKKCSSVQVHEIFEELVMSGLQPTAATYNTLITAYAAQGSWLNALTALTQMLHNPVGYLYPSCLGGKPILFW